MDRIKAFKMIADRRALEMMEWAGVAAAIVLVAYLAYQFLGNDIANFVRGLGGIF